MSEILESYKKYPGITEAREVVKTVQVVRNREIYLVNVYKVCHCPPIHYDVDYWRYEDVIMQQSDMRDGKYVSKPERMTVLVEVALPWVSQPTPDLALHQALNFLSGNE